MAEWVSRSLKLVGFCVILAALFTWFGVYNTDRMPVLQAYGLWLMTMLVGGFSSMVLIPRLEDSPIGDMHPAIGIFITSALISIPVTLSLLLLSMNPFTIYHVSSQYIYVLIISLFITTIGWTTNIFDIMEQNSVEKDTDTAPPSEKFLERLPVKYRTADLWALCSEDHYLRVYTSLGEDLILMRLSDAVRELEGADGLQVHRSWWISVSAIRDTSKEKSKTRLHLPDGTIVPVSRSKQAAARSAGLI